MPGLGRDLPAAAADRPVKGLKVIIENALSQDRMLRGPRAFELGMADAMVGPADFLEESLRCAARVLNGEIAVRRAPVPETSAADRDAAVAAARFVTDGKLHGAAPVPWRALDLVAAAKDRTRDAGFAAGWPFHLGGITPYLDRTGIAEKVTGSRFR